MTWEGVDGGVAEGGENHPEVTEEAEVPPQEQVDEVPPAVTVDPIGMS